MIAVAIIVASVFAIGGVLLHALYTVAELNGYIRGLEDAEQIFVDVNKHHLNNCLEYMADKYDTSRAEVEKELGATE